jgi:hypothetical protein
LGGNSNAATNPTNNATPSAGGSLFGTNANTTNNGTEAQKSNVFGGGGNLFGNQSAPATGGLFGGGGASGKTGSVFGPKPNNQSTIPKPSTNRMCFTASPRKASNFVSSIWSRIFEFYRCIYISFRLQLMDLTIYEGTDSSGGFFGSTTPKPPDNASAAGANDFI